MKFASVQLPVVLDCYVIIAPENAPVTLSDSPTNIYIIPAPLAHYREVWL